MQDAINPTVPTPARKLLLSAREAAASLSISERTLWAVTVPRGTLPVVRIPGGRGVRYSVESLQNWIAGQESAIDAQPAGETGVSGDTELQ
jgi:predicted DNA-binding transcriptional regulator AlpA